MGVAHPDQARQWPNPDGQIQHPSAFQRTKTALLLLASVFTVAVGLHLIPAVPTWVTELFLAVLAAVTVHLLDHWWLFKDTQKALDELNRDIQSGVTRRADELVERSTSLTTTSLERIEASIQRTIVQQTKSLDAMARSGIVRIYPSRDEAAEDLHRDLTSQSTSKIRIIGISLNDFVFAQQPRLAEAWTTILNFVRRGAGPGRTVDIRILLIDPNCLGAQLRALGEARSENLLPGRLHQEVTDIAAQLQGLADIAQNKRETTGVTFQCRLYRLPPMLFLCLVDSVCYVQQYHFWSKRVRGTPVPVVKYRSGTEPAQLYPMHTQMEAHFDWVWEKASIDVKEFSQQAAIGAEAGMDQASAVNVYTDPNSALKRMLYLLNHAESAVAIQGVSLQSFCKTGELLLALQRLIEAGKVRIRMLFIDPECEQARSRSYREAQFERETLSWQRYQAENLHRGSDLYRDTNRAIMKLGDMVRSIVGAAGQVWKLNLEAGLYRSAPHCFLLMVDDSILVEQYQYGKIVPAEKRGAPAILGKDMPVVEYANRPPKLYEEKPLRRPYLLLKDNFEFAWRLAEPIDLGGVRFGMGDVAPGEARPAARTAGGAP